MAHTDRDSDSDPPAPAGIIQQKPPPPPGYKAPDGDEQTVDPAAPTDPQAPEPRAPQEGPPQPIPPRVAGAPGPASSPGRRIGRKASGPHLIVSPDLKPEIISAGSMRPRASSSPELMLLGFPSRHATPARSSLSR